MPKPLDGHKNPKLTSPLQAEKEDNLISSLQNFSFEKEFQIILSNFSCFEPRVIFIEVKQNNQLQELQHKLVHYVKKKLQLFNQSDDMRGFHPHVTIAFKDLKKPLFYKVWDDYKSKTLDATFNCESICLLKHLNDRWEIYKTFPFVVK